jgi:hypothetical protein
MFSRTILWYNISVRMVWHNFASTVLTRLLGVLELAVELRCRRHHLLRGKGVIWLLVRRMVVSKIWMWHFSMLSYARGMRLRSWFRHYATIRKVAGSIPYEVIGFFSWPNLSTSTMALGSTQPLTEMRTRNIPEDKGKADLTAIC